MGKELKIYFKRGSTLFTLNNFPKSYKLIISNWNSIVEAYKKANDDAINEEDKVKKVVKRLFAKVPKMTLEQERFDELKKDLKFKDNTVTLFLKGTGGRLVEISARKDEDNLDKSK